VRGCVKGMVQSKLFSDTLTSFIVVTRYPRFVVVSGINWWVEPWSVAETPDGMEGEIDASI